MMFVKNGFLLEGTTRLQDIDLKPGETIQALNDDGSLYGMCGAVTSPPLIPPQTYTLSSSCNGPVSAGLPSFIKGLAWTMELKLKIEVDETGWIFKRQNIRYRVTASSKDKLNSFEEHLMSAITAYQRRMEN